MGRQPGINVLRCDPFYLGRLWRDWSFSRSICRSVAHHRFDLVQSHERIPCCDLYRAGDGVHREWLAQRARALGPLGRLGIALNPYHHYVKYAERRLFESPSLKAVICNSRMVRDEILHYFRIAPEKLYVIYSGVDTEAFHPNLRRYRAEVRTRYGVPEDATLFLFVGSGFERKGVGRLLEAMIRLPPSTYALIIGRDKHQARFEAKARALGLHERVQFLGSLPDVKPYYGAADALVLPTLYDPFPNVALEAMASGLPVATSTKCGAAEIITSGANGYICDAMNVNDLFGAMRAVVAEGSLEHMRAAARATAEHRNLSHMANSLRKLYIELAEQ